MYLVKQFYQEKGIWKNSFENIVHFHLSLLYFIFILYIQYFRTGLSMMSMETAFTRKESTHTGINSILGNI